ELEAVGVPAGPINTLEQVHQDPHVLARGLRLDLPHSSAGTIPSVASPLRLSETPVEYRHAAPLLGEHTDAVLKEYLNLTDDATKELTKCRPSILLAWSVPAPWGGALPRSLPRPASRYGCSTCSPPPWRTPELRFSRYGSGWWRKVASAKPMPPPRSSALCRASAWKTWPIDAWWSKPLLNGWRSSATSFRNWKGLLAPTAFLLRIRRRCPSLPLPRHASRRHA